MGNEFDLEDEAFRREFLRGVDHLADEAGGWRDHVPYEAARGFLTDTTIREKFRAHSSDANTARISYCCLESLRTVDSLCLKASILTLLT